VLGRVEVQTNDVAHFLDEEGIVGELEVALTMGLDTEQFEPALHRTLGHAGLFGQGTHAPVGTVCRLGLQRGVDDLGDAFVVMRTGASAAKLIMQSFDTLFMVALAPLSDRCLVQSHACGDSRIGLSLGTGENNLCTLDQPMGQRARGSETEQLGFLLLAQDNRCDGTTAWHGQAPVDGLPDILPGISGTPH
jgi:hypothetical protein